MMQPFPTGRESVTRVLLLTSSSILRDTDQESFQMRTVWSWLAVATWAPLHDQATLLIPSVWPLSMKHSVPVWAFQMRAVPSLLAVTRYTPSGDQAALSTRLVWPRRG